MTNSEVALLLLRAIHEQKDPKLRAMLIEKLGTGPSGDIVADCIERLTQLGLTIQEPEENPTTLDDAKSAPNRTIQ
jgi:hypothetical protein